MRKLFIYVLLLAAGSVLAQDADSVSTAAGANEVYYDIETGSKTVVAVDDWDLAFAVPTMEVSVLINEASGTELYVYSADTNDWASIDTTGFDFETNKVNNSDEDWSTGAFNNLGTNHPDYGWGTYNTSNHSVNGSRVFILKKSDGSFYQIVIVRMTAAGQYTLKIGELGGANTYYTTFNRGQFPGQNFVYYSIDNDETLNLEPSGDWQMLFTKYVAAIPAGPSTLYYPVTGVKVNKGVEVAERTGVEVSDNDTTGLVWSTNITEIGYDWKSFNGAGYDITEDLSYFIRLENGNIYKVWFTDYAGGAEGTSYFNTELVYSTASISNNDLPELRVYPNPSNGQFVIDNKYSGNLHVEVLSQTGVQVQTIDLMAGKNILDLTDQASGLYYVRLVNERGSKLVKLIIE
ncbi:T9SS type A sorting domain-containing protein [bacterium]|nr:T9SS type A sorting domain-containing protein [bacterium]